MQDTRNRKNIALVEEDDSELLELPDLMDDSDYGKLAKYAMRKQKFPEHGPFQKPTKTTPSKETFDIQFVSKPTTASQPNPTVENDEPLMVCSPSSQPLPSSAKQRINHHPTPTKRTSVNLGKRVLLQEFEKVSQPAVVSPFENTLSFTNFGLDFPEAHSTPQYQSPSQPKFSTKIPDNHMFNKENFTAPVAPCSNLAIHINLNSPQKQQPQKLPSAEGVQCISMAPPTPLPRPNLDDLVDSYPTSPRNPAHPMSSSVFSPSKPAPASHFDQITPTRRHIPSTNTISSPKDQFLAILNNKLLEKSLKKAPAPPTAEPSPPRVQSIPIEVEVQKPINKVVNPIVVAIDSPLEPVPSDRVEVDAPLKPLPRDRVKIIDNQSPSHFIKNYVKNVQHTDDIQENSPGTIQKLHLTFSKPKPNRDVSLKPTGTVLAQKTSRRTERLNEDVLAYLELEQTINSIKASGNQRRMLYSKGNSLSERESDQNAVGQGRSSTETNQPLRKTRKLSANQNYSITSDEDSATNHKNQQDIGEFIEGSQPPAATTSKSHTSAKTKSNRNRHQSTSVSNSDEDLLNSMYLKTDRQLKTVTVQNRKTPSKSRIVYARSDSNTSFEIQQRTPAKPVASPQLSQKELDEQIELAFRANRQLRRSNAIASQPLTKKEVRKSTKKVSLKLVNTENKRINQNGRIVASYSGASSSSENEDQLVAFKPRNRLRRTNENDAGGDGPQFPKRKKRTTIAINTAQSEVDENEPRLPEPKSVRKSSSNNLDHTTRTIHKSMNMSIMMSPSRFERAPSPMMIAQQSMYDAEDIDLTICETQTQNASPTQSRRKINNHRSDENSPDKTIVHKKTPNVKRRPRKDVSSDEFVVENEANEQKKGNSKTNEIGARRTEEEDMLAPDAANNNPTKRPTQSESRKRLRTKSKPDPSESDDPRVSPPKQKKPRDLSPTKQKSNDKHTKSKHSSNSDQEESRQKSSTQSKTSNQSKTGSKDSNFSPDKSSFKAKSKNKTVSEVENKVADNSHKKYGKQRSKQTLDSDSESEVSHEPVVNKKIKNKPTSKHIPDSELLSKASSVKQNVKGKPKSQQIPESDSESNISQLLSVQENSKGKPISKQIPVLDSESEASNVSVVKHKHRTNQIPDSDSESEDSHVSVVKKKTENKPKSKPINRTDSEFKLKSSSVQQKTKKQPKSKQIPDTDSESEVSHVAVVQQKKGKSNSKQAPFTDLESEALHLSVLNKKTKGKPKLKPIAEPDSKSKALQVKQKTKDKTRSKQTTKDESESDVSKKYSKSKPKHIPDTDSESEASQVSVVTQKTKGNPRSKQIPVSESESDVSEVPSDKQKTKSKSCPKKQVSKVPTDKQKTKNKPIPKPSTVSDSLNQPKTKGKTRSNPTDESDSARNPKTKQTTASEKPQTKPSQPSDSETELAHMSPEISQRNQGENHSDNAESDISMLSLEKSNTNPTVDKPKAVPEQTRRPVGRPKSKQVAPSISKRKESKAKDKTNTKSSVESLQPSEIYESESCESAEDVRAAPVKKKGKPKSKQSPKPHDTDSDLSDSSDVFLLSFVNAMASQESNPDTNQPKGKPKSKQPIVHNESNSDTDQQEANSESDNEVPSQVSVQNSTNDSPMCGLGYGNASYCTPVVSGGNFRHSSRCGRHASSSSSDNDDPPRRTITVQAAVHNANNSINHSASETPVRRIEPKQGTSSDATFQSCISDPTMLDNQISVDQDGTSASAIQDSINSTANKSKRGRKRKHFVTDQSKPPSRSQYLKPVSYRAAPQDPAELEKYPMIRRSSRVKQHPIKYWLNDIQPLSPVLVYFTQKGQSQPKPPPKRKAAINTSAQSNNTNMSRMGHGFMADMLTGTISKPETALAIMTLSKNIKISTKNNMICHENGSVEYWYYATQVDCSRGYMKFRKDSKKKSCRTSEGLELLMCFGTVSITHDDITEDISSGDLVVISAGTRYSIRNHLDDVALIFFSKSPAITAGP